jgi:predicted permease
VNPFDDVARELRVHVDMLIEDLIAGGMTRAEAEAEAARRFGNVDPVARECTTISRRARRRTQRSDSMRGLYDDARQAVRSLRQAPLLTIIISLTLMIGIGATTTIFSIVDQVLLRPLAYAAPERLLMIRDDVDSDNPLSFPEYSALKQVSGGTFSDVGAWFASTLTLTGVDEPVVLKGDRLSASVPRMLGVRPILGRTFADADDNPAGDRLLMLSEASWRRLFNADPAIVGRVLTLEGLPFTVIGVYPSDATTLLPDEIASGRRSDYWQSLRLDNAGAPADLHFMSVIARLSPGLPASEANARLHALAGRLHSLTGGPHTPTATSLSERVIGPAKPMVELFAAAVLLVLLIACANVAGLLIARAAARQRELAVRSAIGASGGRIASQLIIESVLRSLIGGALGIAFAYALLATLRATTVLQLPRMRELHVDTRLLAFAVLLSLAVGLVCGVVPALRARRIEVASALREGGRGAHTSLGADAFRRALVVFEISLSFSLLVSAGLLLESFQRLLHVDKGFDPEHVVSAALNLPGTRYPDDVRQLAFYRDALARVRAIPGVSAAALTSGLPIEAGTNGGVGIEGRTFAPNEKPLAEKRIVSVGYFETLGAKTLTGRSFEARDAGGPASVIVNATFVKKYLGGGPAVGRRVDFSWDTHGLQTIVGVVDDVREGPLDESPHPAIYIPLAQRPSSSMYLVVRTAMEPTSLVPAMRAAVLSADARMPLSDVRLLTDVIEGGASLQRTGSWLLGAFSILALALATIGLYGVISYAVLQRMREFGVRSALGASRGELLRLVADQAARFVVIGLAIGAVIARGGAALLRAQLFGVSATSPAVYVVVALVLSATAALAVIAPAIRASRADPLVALRAE